MNNKEVTFNLTDKMQKSLINFFELETKLKNFTSKDNNLSKKDIEEKMNTYKREFINEFRKNNKNEIYEYLKLKYKG